MSGQCNSQNLIHLSPLLWRLAFQDFSLFSLGQLEYVLSSFELRTKIDEPPLHLLCFLSQPHSYYQLLGHSHCHSQECMISLATDKHLLCHSHRSCAMCLESWSPPSLQAPPLPHSKYTRVYQYHVPQPAVWQWITTLRFTPRTGTYSVTWRVSSVCQELEVCESNPPYPLLLLATPHTVQPHTVQHLQAYHLPMRQHPARHINRQSTPEKSSTAKTLGHLVWPGHLKGLPKIPIWPRHSPT